MNIYSDALNITSNTRDVKSQSELKKLTINTTHSRNMGYLSGISTAMNFAGKIGNILKEDYDRNALDALHAMDAKNPATILNTDGIAKYQSKDEIFDQASKEYNEKFNALKPKTKEILDAKKSLILNKVKQTQALYKQHDLVLFDNQIKNYKQSIEGELAKLGHSLSTDSNGVKNNIHQNILNKLNNDKEKFLSSIEDSAEKKALVDQTFDSLNNSIENHVINNQLSEIRSSNEEFFDLQDTKDSLESIIDSPRFRDVIKSSQVLMGDAGATQWIKGKGIEFTKKRATDVSVSRAELKQDMDFLDLTEGEQESILSIRDGLVAHMPPLTSIKSRYLADRSPHLVLFQQELQNRSFDEPNNSFDLDRGYMGYRSDIINSKDISEDRKNMFLIQLEQLYNLNKEELNNDPVKYGQNIQEITRPHNATDENQWFNYIDSIRAFSQKSLLPVKFFDSEFKHEIENKSMSAIPKLKMLSNALSAYKYEPSLYAKFRQELNETDNTLFNLIQLGYSDQDIRIALHTSESDLSKSSIPQYTNESVNEFLNSMDILHRDAETVEKNKLGFFSINKERKLINHLLAQDQSARSLITDFLNTEGKLGRFHNINDKDLLLRMGYTSTYRGSSKTFANAPQMELVHRKGLSQDTINTRTHNALHSAAKNYMDLVRTGGNIQGVSVRKGVKSLFDATNADFVVTQGLMPGVYSKGQPVSAVQTRTPQEVDQLYQAAYRELIGNSILRNETLDLAVLIDKATGQKLIDPHTQEPIYISLQK